MCREFITRFRGARPLERKPNVLRDIKQGESETLKEYVERFHKEVINLGAYDEENTLEDFIRNIWICRLWFNFQDFRPKDYTEAYERALCFIETEEQLRLKKVTERAEYSSKKEKGKGREENQGDRNSHPMITGGIPRLQPRGHDQLKTLILQPQLVMNVPNEMHSETFRRARTWNSKYANYHALNATREQILAALHETGLLTKPEPLRGDPSRRNQAKYLSLTIAGKVIPRILTDTGSSVDIMFKKTLDHLGIEKARLREVNTPLYDFTGDSIWPVGTIDIPITFGEDPDQFTTMITYVVVDAPGIYSVILGRPFLVATKAGVSLYHNVMKISTGEKIETIRGDQESA
ncbi:hypothetical protein LWI29_038254 [Acer saccharum]|uniref:Retrotransposon gag domain-containing protein n=1 Tax=Acer saccharum TaxID=4024 RepID=A0AA39RSW4_ACESA|nr:hypothetical protein LWI29_038254 [Acer saccharum]